MISHIWEPLRWQKINLGDLADDLLGFCFSVQVSETTSLTRGASCIPHLGCLPLLFHTWPISYQRREFPAKDPLDYVIQRSRKHWGCEGSQMRLPTQQRLALTLGSLDQEERPTLKPLGSGRVSPFPLGQSNPTTNTGAGLGLFGSEAFGKPGETQREVQWPGPSTLIRLRKLELRVGCCKPW